MKEALKLALYELEGIPVYRKYGVRISNAITAIKEALAPTSTQCEVQPEQEPVAWKLVPRDPTDEMLKAMDECSTEGYDERLCAGHAASVYMAAWDEAPTPPQPEQEPWMYRIWNDKDAQWRLTDDCSWPAEPIYTTPPKRPWVGLTDEERDEICLGDESIARAIEAKLKEKNT